MDSKDENQLSEGQLGESNFPINKRLSSEHADEENSVHGDTNHLTKKAKLEGTVKV